MVRAANELTARWVRTECSGAATAVSGLGVWPLLALMAAAAEGRGRAELEQAAGVAASGADEHARELLRLIGESSSTRAALGVWTRGELPIEPWWREAVPADTWGELHGDSDADQARLDAWVSRRTDGQLERMPVRVDPSTVLLLAAALSVRTRWRQPFTNTELRPRRGPWAGRAKPLAGLTRTTGDLDQLAVASTPAGPVTLLTVRGVDDVDVHLVLGEEARRPGEVLAAGMEAVDGRHPLTRGADLVSVPERDQGPGVAVHRTVSFSPEPTLTARTVRFDVTAEHDLLATPELFGLTTVSTDTTRGHFPGISPFPLAVSQARQDVTATFSAEGFEAAVITAVGMEAAGLPANEAYAVNAVFDRPFGFVARHRPSGLVLLAGWVTDPEDWPDNPRSPHGDAPWSTGVDWPAPHPPPPAPRWRSPVRSFLGRVFGPRR